ncbi:branched-chain amino acid transport system II carrier protein [Anaerotignum lactatifermentans]|uniref:Branched-chain amino acid transport system carrier protein n=1 Tax=Anaerotignum lactatifermentans TaxID=160404 RepID=A0ABS2GCD1_9FIRM|nr:branched-chain amino acid transport system II carrier protein [Anaerotignum lactatifermentans]MBM6830234.1 branched-chain amino acid transport system II carrier protein [Anaerotignum lactatifermentans]MBM6878842.1 branched-chain amino acid transport system II carrier protein [Anaerotignum lactatifermentans]MBM6951847.1 branched-chain amino acid transport system II carrier protein [Anaerotignum lactatifermentans]
MKPASKKYDPIVIGLAIFAMFFGAGSLIFPPYLGMTAGTQWPVGFVCFFLTDIGLAFVTIVAMVKGDGTMSGITGVIGKVPSVIINTVVLVCIGPLFVVPRSAATTYEMTIVPLVPQMNLLIFTIIFFGIVLILAIRRSRLVDVIGKYLTPIMVVALVILIAVGVAAPLGEVVAPASENIAKDGIIAGYQAMDVLGALTVAIVVVATVTQRGYLEKKMQVSITGKACLISGFMLLLVYCGLTYLGATASMEYDLASVNQASLIVAITNDLLGFYGTLLLGIIVALASLTTAVGVASAVAAYFETLLGGRVSYNIIITVIIVFSTVVANFGLTTIISFAEPILSVVYPTVITLIIMSFFRGKIKNRNTYKGATLVAFIMSVCTVLNNYGVSIGFIEKMPLAEFGFEWIIPTVIGGIIGSLIKTKGSVCSNSAEAS